MLRLVILFAGLLAVQGQTTNVQRCTGSAAQNAPLPINAYVERCVEPPCQLPQGSLATVHFTFKAPRTTTRMTTRAQMFSLFAIGIALPLHEQAETCDYLTGSSCPIAAGDVVHYTLKSVVSEFLPVGLTSNLEIMIEDDANVPITCARLRMIVAPPSA
ncbi:hypothetical protein ABMA28_008935 [Loxostege sticticalis]|uniref:MD-2-related lipid-recognition domain-containing protein n=1 Tax=Loxostege sticticalis TaxID=481309 RepID=A0ABD0SF71_LOXSC